MVQNQTEAGQQILINYMFNKGLCMLTVNSVSSVGHERKSVGEITEN